MPLPTPLGKIFESLLERFASLSSFDLLMKYPQMILVSVKGSGARRPQLVTGRRGGPGVRLKAPGLFLSRAPVLGSQF